MNKKTIIISSSVILGIGLIVWLIYYINKSKKTDNTQINTQEQGGSTSSNTPCKPYTDEMYNRDVQKARSKCSPQGAIPIVGPGLYIRCMQKEKSKLPPINNCY